MRKEQLSIGTQYIVKCGDMQVVATLDDIREFKVPSGRKATEYTLIEKGRPSNKWITRSSATILRPANDVTITAQPVITPGQAIEILKDATLSGGGVREATADEAKQMNAIATERLTTVVQGTPGKDTPATKNEDSPQDHDRDPEPTRENTLSISQRAPAGTVGAALARVFKRDTPKQGKPPHVIIEARAGTGKTTTLIEGLKRVRGLPSDLTPSPQQAAVWESMMLSRNEARTVGFCAFNNSIANELKHRVPAGCEAMTIHSFGYRVVRAAFPSLKGVNKYRVVEILCRLTGMDIDDLKRDKPFLVNAVEELTKMVKVNLVHASTQEEWDTELSELASYYDVDLGGEDCPDYTREAFDLVPQVIRECKNVHKDKEIDFNDMIWLPVVLKLPVSQYDLLLVDEAQDLNRCQQALVKRAGRRLIFCGDPKQAIYGFAGADCESMPRLADELRNTDRGCVVLPLTVTRRCGKAIVREANKVVPDFEAFETNNEGRVFGTTLTGGGTSPVPQAEKPRDGNGRRPGPAADGYVTLVDDGNFVLCRVNAPLVSECFRFLRMGRKAIIQGRDIGENLINAVKKTKAHNVSDLIHKIEEWGRKECDKENAKRHPNERRLLSIQDRVDCIISFTEGANTVDDVLKKINSVFADKQCRRCNINLREEVDKCPRCKGPVERPTGIRLSSIHKSKGLEAKKVFLLQLKGACVPHPMAKTAWQREQESNLLYVAITRAIEELCYVTEA